MVNAPNREGKTPLHLADGCHIVKALLHSNANPTIRDSKGNWPAIYLFSNVCVFLKLHTQLRTGIDKKEFEQRFSKYCKEHPVRTGSRQYCICSGTTLQNLEQQHDVLQALDTPVNEKAFEEAKKVIEARNNPVNAYILVKSAAKK